MSAIAPLGRPSRNIGKVEAVCTRATQIGVVVSEVIIHAAATSFIHMQILAISQVPHSMRNTGRVKGTRADRELASEDSVEAASTAFCEWGGNGISGYCR